MPTDRQNSSWLSLQFIAALVFSLVTLKLNISHFGADAFGRWIVLASIWGFGTALDLGFGTAVVKYVAEFRNDRARMDTILSSSFVLFVVNGLLIFGGGIVVGYMAYFRDGGIIAPSSEGFYLRIFLLLGASFYLQYLSLFFKSIAEGLSDFVVTSKLTMLQNIAIFAGVVVITLARLNLIVLSLLYLTASCAIFISYLFYFRFRLRSYSLRLRHFRIAEIRMMLTFSLSVQAITVFNSAIDPIVKYMMGAYLNVGIVPAYEVARRFAISISGLFFNAFKIILPKASILKSAQEIHSFVMTDIAKYCRFGIVYSGAAFGVMALALMLVLSLVFGLRDSVVIFVILALPETINNFGYAIYNFLLGVGKVRLLALVQLNNLLVVVVCLIVGFGYFQTLFGLLGYFVSVAIGNIGMVLYMKRKWNLPIREFFSGSGFYKLIVLAFVLGTVLVLLSGGYVPAFTLFLCVSCFSFVLFYAEMKYYFAQLKKMFTIRYAG